MSGGGLAEAPLDGASCSVLAHQDEQVRALTAEFTTPAGAHVSWLRGPLPLNVSVEEHLPTPDSPATTFPFTELIRQTLATHGWHFSVAAADRTQRRPVITLHRQDNGWYFSGYTPDTTVELSLCTPFGAPLLLGSEAILQNGVARYRLPRAWRHECRVFIEQATGTASAVEACPAQVGVTRRLWIRGLRNAVVRFFPVNATGPVTLWLDPAWPQIDGARATLREVHAPQGPLLESTEPLTGTALLSW